MQEGEAHRRNPGESFASVRSPYRFIFDMRLTMSHSGSAIGGSSVPELEWEPCRHVAIFNSYRSPRLQARSSLRTPQPEAERFQRALWT
jgi:hypothetical protein